MRKFNFLTAFLIMAVALTSVNVNAQRYVDVAPGIGTLNEAIKSDTADNGDRFDLNTIYRLQRGNEAYYGLEGSIENKGYPLTIEAAAGDGARPFLQPRIVGTESARPFRPKGDITLKGLHVTGMDDLGGQTTRMLRCSEDDIRVIIDNCWFDKEGQSFIRCDNPGLTIKLTNSVISNIGYPNDANNGRVIDDRGNALDTVIMENCTFYNISSRVIRDDGGVIDYARVNNNNFINVGQYGITFGPISTLELKNNNFINAGFLPTDIADPNYLISADSVGTVAPVVTIMKNNVWVDAEMITPYLTDTTILVPLFNETLSEMMEADPKKFSMLGEKIEFANGSPFNDSLLIYSTDPLLDIANAPFWEVPAIPSVGDGGNGIYHLDVPYSYDFVNSIGFVAATDEKQLGDRNWMAERGVFDGVDFEANFENVLWGQFANDGDAFENLTIVENPDKSGLNQSDNALKFIVMPGASLWAGAYSDAYGSMTFTTEMHHMEMMVYKDVISNCALKVEMGGTVTELKVPNTVTNAWELITVDFTANIGETLTRLVIFPDYPDSRTAGSMSYLDNIKIVTAPVGVKNVDGSALKVYPNPASDHMIVQYPGMTSIEVRNVLGKSVMSINLASENYSRISLENLNEGVYFITVGTGNNSITTKFLKK